MGFAFGIVIVAMAFAILVANEPSLRSNFTSSPSTPIDFELSVQTLRKQVGVWKNEFKGQNVDFWTRIGTSIKSILTSDDDKLKSPAVLLLISPQTAAKE